MKFITLMIMAFSLSTQAKEVSSLKGEIVLTPFQCERADDLSVHCFSGEETEGLPFKVMGDNGQAQYIRHSLIGGDILLEIKVGTYSSLEGSYFLTTGISAVNLKNLKELFSQGESITEVASKKDLKTVQVYSPEFEYKGHLMMVKATLSIQE